MMEGWSPDGSWGGSFVETAKRLFGLHLTVRHPNDDVNHGIRWLMGSVDGGAIPGELTGVSGDDLQGLPFVPGEPRILALSMTLFLATIFDHGSTPDAVALYEDLAERVRQGRGAVEDLPSVSNIMRAFVVHPLYAGHAAVGAIMGYLRTIISDGGTWPHELPFYETVNALGHLRVPVADQLLMGSFRTLSETQGPDGSWGEGSTRDREWNTFLVVHALRNKGILAEAGPGGPEEQPPPGPEQWQRY